MNASSPSKNPPEIPGFGCSRYAPVQYLPGATRFSDDDALCDPVEIVRMLRRLPHITARLEQETKPLYCGGRKRMDGHWYLVFLAYMLTGLGDMDRFYKRWGSSKLWKAAGFKHKPSSPTMYLRFVELEQYADAFRDAAGDLIRRARRHQPLVGRAAHADGTGISTHAALEHLCPPGSACRGPRDKASHVARVGDDLVGDIRATEADMAEDELDETPSTALKRLTRTEVEALGYEDKDLYWHKTRPFAWFRQGKHIYRLRDSSASPRMYAPRGAKTKFWMGWNDITVTDTLTGGPLAIEVADAGTQEWAVYPLAMTRVHEAMGIWPQLVSTDRGFVTKANYEFNTRRGIGSVFPWREPRSGYRRRHYETEEYDRHGILRCQHCGGPCDIRGAGLGFYFDGTGDDREPRVRGRCKLRGTEECNAVQSVPCSRDWRYLQPLCLTDEVYNQLGHGHPSSERIHLNLRGRYTQGGKETVMRNKRFGIDCQKLRAAAIMFLEWFRICLRHGWVGTHRKRNDATPALRNAGKRLASILAARKRWAIDLPYGEAARRAGLGKHGPPGPESPLRGKRK